MGKGKKQPEAQLKTTENSESLFAARRGKFQVRKTGIFTTEVPLDASGLISAILDAGRQPGQFLNVCEEYRRTAWRILVKHGVCTSREAATLPFPNKLPDLTWVKTPPVVVDAFLLLHLVEDLRETGTRIAAALDAIGRIVREMRLKVIADSQPPEVRKHLMDLDKAGNRRAGLDLIMELCGTSLGIGEIGLRMLIRQHERFVKGGVARFAALARATASSAEERKKSARMNKAMRRSEMRKLMQQGASRSSAASRLEGKYRNIASVDGEPKGTSRSSFWRSADTLLPAKESTNRTRSASSEDSTK